MHALLLVLKISSSTPLSEIPTLFLQAKNKPILSQKIISIIKGDYKNNGTTNYS